MPFTDRLIASCQAEWEFFRRSTLSVDGSSKVGLREYDDGAWQRVADYWAALGGPYGNLTGKDRGFAWSAAFISWVMREAGAGNQFPYSAGHATYINQAIRDAATAGAPLRAHRLNSYAPQPGDLIGYWRGATPITIDNARKIGWYESHTDIVVEVGNGFINTIGGNVLHSVTKRAVKTNASGHVIDKRQNWFVAIENGIA
jgi:hypothetical protein